MNFKKILFTLVFVLSLLSVSAYAKTMQFTMRDYDAKVDDGAITVHTMEVAPYTVEGRTMVPVRIVGETFGADVQYIHEENKVVITLGDKTISLIIGQTEANVNGEVVPMDVPSFETNGRTLVPLRFVSETLGFDVKYVASTEQILITDDPAVIELNGSKIFLAELNAAYDLYNMEYESYYGEDEILGSAMLMMMNYAVYDSESNKWDIGYPFEYKEEIKATVSDLEAYFPEILDGVWANLLEIEYRTSDLNNFLYQIYLPDEEDIEEYRKTGFNDYMAAKHILVSDKDTATDILNKIKKGADFDELMNEYSEDPGLYTNPDGYVFTDGEMVEEFESAVKKLKVNAVSGIVESDFGYHIIKRIEIPAEYVADSYANEAIANHYTAVIENGELKADAYTSEQLIELCK